MQAKVEQSPTLSGDETALYDRQIRLWGVEAQGRLKSTKVLLIGMNPLAAEIAKNLVLVGVASLKVADDEAVSDTDALNNFLIPIDCVERQINRSEAALPNLKELNPMVEVTSVSNLFNRDTLDDQTLLTELTNCDVAIVTCPLSSKIFDSWSRVSRLLRKQNSQTKIVFTGVYRGFGIAHTDLGSHEFVSEIFTARRDKEGSTPSQTTTQSSKVDVSYVKQTTTYPPLDATLALTWNCQEPTLSVKCTPKALFVLHTLRRIVCQSDESIALDAAWKAWESTAAELGVEPKVLSKQNLELRNTTCPPYPPVSTDTSLGSSLGCQIGSSCDTPPTLFEPHAIAIRNFETGAEGQLQFKTGEVILLKEMIDSQWCRGYSIDSCKQGTFPLTCVEIKMPLCSNSKFNRPKPIIPAKSKLRLNSVKANTPPVSQKEQESTNSGRKSVASLSAGFEEMSMTNKTSPPPPSSLSGSKLGPGSRSGSDLLNNDSPLNNSRSRTSSTSLNDHSSLVRKPTLDINFNDMDQRSFTPPMTRSQTFVGGKPSILRQFRTAFKKYKAPAPGSLLTKPCHTTLGSSAPVDHTISPPSQNNAQHHSATESTIGRERTLTNESLSPTFNGQSDLRPHSTDSYSSAKRDSKGSTMPAASMKTNPPPPPPVNHPSSRHPLKLADATTDHWLLVECDFDAMQEGDLTVKNGDVLLCLDQLPSSKSPDYQCLPESWLRCRTWFGSEGVIPSPFVRRLTDPAEVGSLLRNRPRAKAVYDFLTNIDGDLNFKRGEIIYLHSRVDSNWLRGESSLTGRRGIFPLTYVSVICNLL